MNNHKTPILDQLGNFLKTNYNRTMTSFKKITNSLQAVIFPIMHMEE